MRGDSPTRAMLVAFVAGLFGWILGLVFPLISPQFAAIVSVVAAFAAEVALRLADRGLASPGLRLAELGAAFVVAKMTHLALLGPDLLEELSAFPSGLADSETTLGFLLMWFVRSMAYRTVSDIRLLGSPGDETIGTAYDRLARRFRTLLGVSMILAAFAVAGWQRLAILDRPAIDGLVWPLALMLIIGVAALGGFRRIEDAGRWRRAGARVEQAVWLRWGSGVIAITGLAALAVVLFRAGVDEFARAPALAVRGLAAAGAGLVRMLGLSDPVPVQRDNVPIIQDRPTQTDDDGGIFDFIEPIAPGAEPNAWAVAIITFAWVVVIVGTIALIVAVLRNRRWIRSAFQIGPAEGLRAILIEFTRMLGDLGRLLWSMMTFWRRQADEAQSGEGLGDGVSTGTSRAVPPWDRSDPIRNRIGAAYHRFLESAGRLLPRHRTETPDEYARAVGDHLRFGTAEADELTNLYVEARYSDHEILEEKVETAERLSEDLDLIVEQQAEGQGP